MILPDRPPSFAGHARNRELRRDLAAALAKAGRALPKPDASLSPGPSVQRRTFTTDCLKISREAARRKETVADDEMAKNAVGWSAFFFELFFLGRSKPGGRAERFTVIENRQIAHVQRQDTSRRLLIHDNRHGTALDAVAKHDAAAAGKARVRESLQHLAAIIPWCRVIWRSSRR